MTLSVRPPQAPPSPRQNHGPHHAPRGVVPSVSACVSVGAEAGFPGPSFWGTGRYFSPSFECELPSAPDTVLQTLVEWPGQRPLLFLWNSKCCNLAALVQLEQDRGSLGAEGPQSPLASLLPRLPMHS